MGRKLFTLRTTYLIVFVSLILWAVFAYKTMTDLIESQKAYAKLINLSGQQRMLSQKTTLMVKRIYETDDPKLLEHLISLRKQMMTNHQYIIDNLPSSYLKKIYFQKPVQLNKKTLYYFSLLEKFPKQKSPGLIHDIEEYSFQLLPDLEKAVDEFEQELTQKTQNLKHKELTIFIGTLLTIIFEALLIVLPTIRNFYKKQRELEKLNITLEYEVLQKIQETRKKDKLLAEQTKLAAMGEMISNIAHQWRQPLSVISTAATGLKAKNDYGLLEVDDINKSCTVIDEHAQYLSHTIENFRKYIEGDAKPIRFDLKNDTDSFIKLVDATIKKYNITVILNLQENIKVQGYPNELIQCFINIFNNARDSLIQNNPENERFIFISQKVKKKHVIITFKDNAGGIPKDIIAKIYEPYFTTKYQSQGTGLGLHMTYNIITKSMQGKIEVENDTFTFNNKKYTGAKFTITLPLP